MRQTLTLTALAMATALALASCNSTQNNASPLPGNTSSCEDALVQQLRDGIAAGASATPGTRPPACRGIDDATLNKLATQAMGTVFSSAFPDPSISAPQSFTIPDLTGMTLDLADALATEQGEYTTPESADGGTPTITAPGDWTVCSQTPAPGTTTDSNGIIVTVADTAAGKRC